MNENQQKALDRFRSGFGCAQAVFSAYAPGLGLDEEAALRAACGFGGGMGRLGEVCGVLTGAFLLAGLRHGNTRTEDAAARKKTYALVGELAERFRALHGDIRCRDLLGCDLNSKEGWAAFKEGKLRKIKCESYLLEAAALVEELVL